MSDRRAIEFFGGPLDGAKRLFEHPTAFYYVPEVKQVGVARSIDDISKPHVSNHLYCLEVTIGPLRWRYVYRGRR